MATALLVNSYWADKALYDDAEKKYYENLAQTGLSGTPALATIDKACKGGQCGSSALADALKAVQGQLDSLQKRVAALEVKCATCPPSGCQPSAPAAVAKSAAPKTKPTPADDDDVDLFGSESEDDEEAERIKEERVAAYAAKKSKKPALIAKSSIILDVKPWDDETDMKALETDVRKIEMDGLLWGASKLVPLAYGIHKLQITCVVEDEKVSVDLLTETIEGIEELVQSVDIAAFNKI